MTKPEIAKHIFARNPKVKELHITSDGQAFYEKHQAEGHAGRLKDQKVETVVKTELAKQDAADKAAETQKTKSAAPGKKATKKVVKETPAFEKTDANAAGEKAVKETPVKELPKSFPFLEENVGPASEEIKKVSSVEELDAIAAAENAAEARKGVHDAIEARRAQLIETNTQKPE